MRSVADIMVRSTPDGDHCPWCPCGRPSVLAMTPLIGQEVYLCADHAEALRDRLDSVLRMPVPTIPDLRDR